MDEAQTGDVSEVEQPVEVAETPAEPVDDSPAPPATPSLQDLLDSADSKELRKHPKIAGIIGSEAQRLVQDQTTRQAQAVAQKAHQDREDALMRMMDDNSDWVKENHPQVFELMQEKKRQRAEEQLTGLRGKTIEEVGTAIGQTFQALPEWKGVTPEELSEIATSLAGKSDHEAIATFNQKALDLVAGKRAQQLHSAWVEKELPKIKEAIRQEERAARLGNTPGPDTKRGSKTSDSADVNSMSKEQFDSYWESLKQRG
jgi:hypothetical protein